VEIRNGVNLADGHYKAGIRPESFYLDDCGAKLDVDSIRMTGRDLLIFSKLGQTPVRVLVHSYLQIALGDKFGVGVREGHILVFDNQEKLIGRF
jgi:multiple sugar transport system ATP-binding protein